MIKTCQICNKEFETTYPNKRYCSKECSREQTREADRLRKSKEREIIKKKQTAEYIETRRLKMAEIDIRTEERARESQADLKKRLKEGDPKAIMKVTNHFDLEYWEAYKEVFMQDYYNKNNTRYVNDISVYEEDFASRVVASIKELGYIYDRLVRSKLM